MSETARALCDYLIKAYPPEQRNIDHATQAALEWLCLQLDAIRAQLESMNGGDAHATRGRNTDPPVQPPDVTPLPVGTAGGEYTIGQYLDLVEPVRMQGNKCIYCPYEHNGFHHQNCRWYAWGRLRDKLQETLIRLSHALAPPPAPILAALNELEPSLGPAGYEYCQACGVSLKDGHAPRCRRAAWELLSAYLRDVADKPAAQAAPNVARATDTPPPAVLGINTSTGDVVYHAKEPGQVITSPPAPTDEPFRPGLPPEALRKVCAEWLDEQCTVFTFRDWAYRHESWPNGSWSETKGPKWTDGLHPYARTWLSVQTDAAAMLGREDAQAGRKMIELGKLAVALGRTENSLQYANDPIRKAYVDAFIKVHNELRGSPQKEQTDGR